MTEHEEQIEKLRERLKEAAGTLKVANDELEARRIRIAELEAAIAVRDSILRDCTRKRILDAGDLYERIYTAQATSPETALAPVIAALREMAGNDYEKSGLTLRGHVTEMKRVATAALASLGYSEDEQ